MIDPATILEFIQQQGYLFILLATIIEGPVIAAAAAFAASLGVFDPFTVLFLTIAGISVTDMLYFTLGHCRGRYDMQPLMAEWPSEDRCSWELPVYYELLRRGIRWAARVGEWAPTATA